MRILLTIFLTTLYGFSFANDSSKFTTKYCIAYNTFFNKNRVDNNVYTYINHYNNKRDYFFYLNYFSRNQVIPNKSVSWGAFYDHTLNKKFFFWSFYQGEKSVISDWSQHQLAGGVGVYLINKNKFYLTMNNGPVYKNIDGINELRHNLRFKSRIIIGNSYFETYNYIQPNYFDFSDITFITFNTFTQRIYKKWNFKVYHWLSTNNIRQDTFQYIIIGISFENW